jgi:hypothetical protein
MKRLSPPDEQVADVIAQIARLVVEQAEETILRSSIDPS